MMSWATMILWSDNYDIMEPQAPGPWFEVMKAALSGDAGGNFKLRVNLKSESPTGQYFHRQPEAAAAATRDRGGACGLQARAPFGLGRPTHSGCQWTAGCQSLRLIAARRRARRRAAAVTRGAPPGPGPVPGPLRAAASAATTGTGSESESATVTASLGDSPATRQPRALLAGSHDHGIALVLRLELRRQTESRSPSHCHWHRHWHGHCARSVTALIASHTTGPCHAVTARYGGASAGAARPVSNLNFKMKCWHASHGDQDAKPAACQCQPASECQCIGT